MGSAVSIVVPVLSDAVAAERLLAQIPADPRVEVILADGGSDPELDRLAAERSDIRLLRTGRGRGKQMNAGAAVATGDLLLFLHADSRLPRGWLQRLVTLPPDAVGGWFQFALDDSAWQARVIEHGVRWRVRLFRLPYGDQGLFVSRALFRSLGGFEDMPFLEDVEFIHRLRQRGRCVEVPLPLTTSSRRWRQDGWFRRSSTNMVIVALYHAGVPAGWLERWYTRRRSRSPARGDAA